MKRDLIKTNLSRDAYLFLSHVFQNTQAPFVATLQSAANIFNEAPDWAILAWCGYNADHYPLKAQFNDELGTELRGLITNHGASTELWQIMNAIPK